MGCCRWMRGTDEVKGRMRSVAVWGSKVHLRLSIKLHHLINYVFALGPWSAPPSAVQSMSMITPVSIEFHSCFFCTTDIGYLHPSVDPSLTHFLGEFPGLGLALVPDVVVPEAEIGYCHQNNIHLQIIPCMHGASN